MVGSCRGIFCKRVGEESNSTQSWGEEPQV
jgi:hypothetical protein